MKYLIFLISMFLSTSVMALSYSVNPTTGVFTQTSSEPDVNFATDNVQSLFFSIDEQVILVSTSTRAWLNIEGQWYVLPSNAPFDLVFDEEVIPQVPTGAVASAGPYTSEPILKYEHLSYTEVFGSHYKLVKIKGQWRHIPLPHTCKTGYHFACATNHGYYKCKCILN